MKILVLCAIGSNRSVTVAHQLKFLGHDVLSAGLETNSDETLHLLGNWADRIIVTDKALTYPWRIDPKKFQLWDVGADTYPRPFNKQLLAKVRQLMREHESEYKAIVV